MAQRDEIEELFKRYVGEMSTSDVLKKVQEMFSGVMREIASLKTDVQNDIANVRQEVRGVQARVTLLETKGAQAGHSLAPRQIKTLETYQKTDTGTFRLTDFELHDLHNEAKTWRNIKSFLLKVGVPVASGLVLLFLGWLGLHLWVK